MIKGKKKMDPPCILALCIIDERLCQNPVFVMGMIIRKSCFDRHLCVQQIAKGGLFIHVLSFIKVDVSDS